MYFFGGTKQSTQRKDAEAMRNIISFNEQSRDKTVPELVNLGTTRFSLSTLSLMVMTLLRVAKWLPHLQTHLHMTSGEAVIISFL